MPTDAELEQRVERALAMADIDRLEELLQKAYDQLEKAQDYTAEVTYMLTEARRHAKTIGAL